MNQRTRRLIIVGAAALVVLAVALTAAGVYAIRSVDGPVNTLLERITSVGTEPTLEDNQSEGESDSIYDQGVLVRQVDPDSPAAGAGLRRGSIILSVDGAEVSTPRDLSDLLTEKGAETTVTLSVLNGTAPEDIIVTLADQPPFLGVQLVGADPVGRSAITGRENCVCSFDFELPEGVEEFHIPPDEFHFEYGPRLFGIVITDVFEDSAAVSAGLEPGDVIQSVDGEEMDSVEQLVDLIGSKHPGDTIALSILRDGEPQEITATLGADPDDESRAFLGVRLGSHFDMIRPFGQEDFNFDFGDGVFQSGALIVDIVPDSAAAAAGLRADDIIQAVDGETVRSIDSVIEAIGAKVPGDTVTLSILRDGEQEEIAATLGAHPEDENRAYLGVQIGAFFHVDIERFEEGEGSAPDQFFFHMRPPDDFGRFFGPLPHEEGLSPDFQANL